MCRAWNFANPDAVKRAVHEREVLGERVKSRNLPSEIFKMIRQMLAEGHGVLMIVKTAGCSVSTVYRAGRSD